jgi:hypothetical protein
VTQVSRPHRMMVIATPSVPGVSDDRYELTWCSSTSSRPSASIWVRTPNTAE